ncbi:MAG: hypothetical protein ACLQJR_05685 [Stellaceae bacterium]
MLQNFDVIREAHAFDVEAATILAGYQGRQRVLVILSRETVDDLFPARRLTRDQRILLADRHRDALNRIASAKLVAGQHATYSQFGTTLPLVHVTRDDIARSGEPFSGSVLDIAAGAGFAGADGRVR